MEDAADAVVPLRPGFDVTFRGFDRDQVLEHLEMLETQLELVTIDRNEATRLNSDLRALYDQTREELTATQQRLRHLETSDTGLPELSQRLREMLETTEEELQTLREQARHEAETIRGAAETEAEQLVEQAENTVGELHEQCERVLDEVERRHERLRGERNRQLSELRTREQRMRRAVRDAYKSLMDSARQQAAELTERTRQECARREAETERYRQRVFEEIEHNRSELETLRNQIMTALDTATNRIGFSVFALGEGENVRTEEPGTASSELDEAPAGGAWLPSPRKNLRVTTVMGTPPQPSGSSAGTESEASPESGTVPAEDERHEDSSGGSHGNGRKPHGTDTPDPIGQS
ncbi:DivIVA domain-containing protein [Actinopolyspora mortivallis]|uniref:Cell division protein DivIVA n=1 Tax=Actinopolyspora mortivallis TaxID=33906 RepID=A0A2T0GZN6_ACTMO|nr:DivIVA domain-containing protein [Actinopolyspora mortivallis]PRW64571.1 hypothetical protein CEP50_04245 [Actinopolyspora mortivallis]